MGSEDLIHVHPLNDSAFHDLEWNCWCCPTIEGDVVIHHSADGRELSESINQASGPGQPLEKLNAIYAAAQEDRPDEGKHELARRIMRMIRP